MDLSMDSASTAATGHDPLTALKMLEGRAEAMATLEQGRAKARHSGSSLLQAHQSAALNFLGYIIADATVLENP
jgi:hypothetical protein